MKRQYLKSISLIASFGILALVLSLWIKQPVQSAEINVDRTQKQQVFCAGASSSFYLAEIKPRFSAVASGSASNAIVSNLAFDHTVTKFAVLDERIVPAASPPLWLLNRSLLI
jgi:hypothetical protein